MERKAVSVILLAVFLLTMVVALRTPAPVASASFDDWWNTFWNYRRAVTVENPNPFELIEYPVNITLDTQSLVSVGEMKPDCSDLRLLHNNVEIPFAVVDPNTASTKIVFKSSVPANGNDPNYMLYYGNPTASDASVGYEKIKYEVIDEFNDGVIDPMWSFSYGGYPGVVDVPTHYESDGSLYIEKGPVANLAVASTTGIKINNSEVLHIQCSAYTGEIGWAGYNGMYNYLIKTGGGEIGFSANTYDKSPNRAGPFVDFLDATTGGRISTEISASRIDWTQLNYQWYSYEVYWNKSSNFARMTMNESYYDNENTNGYYEGVSFDELWLSAGAYAPSGTAYAKFDYIRVWQEVSKEPTTSMGSEAPREVSIEWRTKASLPDPRRNAPLVVFDGKIFAFGGIDATDYVSVVHKYDPATDTWTNPTSLPEPRGGSGVAVVNGKIYVIGGSWSSAYPYSQVWEYDPVANSWNTKSSKPTMGHSFGVAVLDNKIYTFGGGMGPAGLSNTVEVYDPSTDTWTSKSAMPWGWVDMGTALVNGKIYLISGGQGIPTVATDLVEEYDPVTDTWSTKTPIPEARGSFASGIVAPVIDNKIYIVGGGGPTNSVDIYDPSSDTWSTGTPMPTPRWGGSCVAVSNKIYVIGGCGTEGVLGTNEEGSVAPPQAHPIADFTYSPRAPYVGETVTFDASASYDLDGTITGYLWDFGDSSSGNGVITTHVYSADGTYTAVLTVIDNDGLSFTKTTNITVLRTSMNVQVKAGSIHFRGEIVEFYVLVSIMGKPVDANINAILYYSGSLYQNLTASAEHVSLGLYRIPYTIPLSASTGTYALVVEAHCLTVSGISLEGFLLSPTLAGWNALMVSINGTVATMKTDLGVVRVDINDINAKLIDINGTVGTLETDLGEIKVDVSNINAKIIALNNTVATIQTDVGKITTDIANIQLRITSINGTTATIQTTLGVMHGTITSIKDNIATIVIPDVGPIEADISSLKGTQETRTIPAQYVIVALALIAAAAYTISIIMIRRRKTA